MNLRNVRTQIALGVLAFVFISASIGGYAMLRDSGENDSIAGPWDERSYEEIVPEQSTNMISFVDLGRIPITESPEEYGQAMKKAYAEGGISFEELLMFDDIIGLSNGEGSVEVSVYNPEAGEMVGNVAFSRYQAEFEANIQRYLDSQGLTANLDTYRIDEVIIKAPTDDPRFAKLVYLFDDVYSSVDRAEEGREVLRKAALDPTEESLGAISDRLLPWGGTIQFEDWMTPVEKADRLDQGYRRVLVEECFYDLRVREYQMLVEGNQSDWDRIKRENSAEIAQLSDTMALIDQLFVERTVGPCMDLYEQSIQIQFEERLTVAELRELQDILPVVYPEGYRPDVTDLDFPLDMLSSEYSERLEEVRTKREQMEVGEYPIRDIDLVVGLFRPDYQMQMGELPPFPVGNAKLFMRTEPGADFEDIAQNYASNRRFNAIPAGSVETYPGTMTEKEFAGSEFAEPQFDGIVLYATILGDEYRCLESLLENNSEYCDAFDLSQSKKDRIQDLVRAIEITPYYPDTRELEDGRELTYDFWWF